MSDKPILDATRALLKFKDSASVREIATMAGQTQRRVLDVLNLNGHMVWRNRKTGRVTKIDPRGVLTKQLRESGEFYFPGTYGAWSVEGRCLRFSGHDALRAELQRTIVAGGLGDSWSEQHVMDNPENRAALEAAGLRLWGTAEIDDRLWSEPAPPPPDTAPKQGETP